MINMCTWDEDFLSEQEYLFCKDVVEKMDNVDWVKPLLKRMAELGFPSNSKELKSFLFELQITNEFFIKDISPKYEYCTGLGDTSVDFFLGIKDSNCLIEAVSVKESEDVKQVTIITEPTPGITMYERYLGGDGKSSPGAEMVKLQGKILSKVVDKDGKPIKYPIPSQKDLHIIIVDARCYLNGGDKSDYLQTMYGPSTISLENRLPYQKRLVRGLWDRKNPESKKTSFIKERVHFVIFVNRKNYHVSLFDKENSYICPNCLLFNDLKEINDKKALVPILEAYPAFT